MQDFIQEVVAVQAWPPATYSAAGTPEWINMKNNRYATFIINTGSITTGEEYKIQKAINAAGSSSTDVPHPFVGNIYYHNVSSASSGTIMAQVTPTSVGADDCIDIADAHDSHVYMATVDAAQATSDSKQYIALVATGSAMASMMMGCVCILHGTRYQNETGYNAVV